MEKQNSDVNRDRLSEGTQKAPPSEAQPATGAQAIHRAAAILRALGRSNDRGAKLADLARRTGLHAATTRRILLALCEEGLVAFEDVTKRYYLGPEVFVMGTAQPYSSWRSRFRTALTSVAGRVGDSSYLSVREGDDSLCIDRAEGREAIRIMFDIGSRLPLGAVASGVAMLAALSEAEAESLIRANAKRFEPYERLSGEVVRQLVREARQQGYAVTHETLLLDVAGVAVPIWGQEGQFLGAMGVALPELKASQERCAHIANVMLDEIRRAGGLPRVPTVTLAG